MKEKCNETLSKKFFSQSSRNSKIGAINKKFAKIYIYPLLT